VAAFFEGADGDEEVAAGDAGIAVREVDVAAGLEDIAVGLEDIAVGLEDIAAGLGEVAAGLEDIAAGLEEVAAGLEDIAAGLEEVAAGLEEFAVGLEDIAAGLEEFAAGLEEVAAGLEEFAAGLEEVAVGLEEMAAGLEDIAAGLEDIAAGLEDVAAGLEDIAACTMNFVPVPGELGEQNLVVSSTAPFQSRHPARCDLLEGGVQLHEHVPEAQPALAGHAVDDASLQLGVTHPLPELVRQRDEQLLQRDLHVGPSGVREAAAGDLRAHAVLEQEALAVGLALGAGAVQLLGVQDLPRVVEADAQTDERRVDWSAHGSEALEEGVGRLAHQADVGQKARWSAEVA
jgi:hypothetical protein